MGDKDGYPAITSRDLVSLFDPLCPGTEGAVEKNTKQESSDTFLKNCTDIIDEPKIFIRPDIFNNQGHTNKRARTQILLLPLMHTQPMGAAIPLGDCTFGIPPVETLN
ncbi:hypothetical protein [Kiloniella litopenaei]|nr:hypothetical protein [Kiloniella litopenaei]